MVRCSQSDITCRTVRVMLHTGRDGELWALLIRSLCELGQ